MNQTSQYQRPWRELPERYGPRTTVYNRYARGVWRDIFEALAQHSEDSLLFTDAAVVKAHRAATGAKGGGLAQDIGSGRGGKIHAVATEKGQLIRAVITGGQVHDSQAIPALFEPDLNAPLAVVAPSRACCAYPARQWTRHTPPAMPRMWRSELIFKWEGRSSCIANIKVCIRREISTSSSRTGGRCSSILTLLHCGAHIGFGTVKCHTGNRRTR